ncbi:hypothetical protein MMC14_004480 [Varicellaria rhodocarpa]|nr:hypothetical protein [Varicellaria rhodocarpa]
MASDTYRKIGRGGAGNFYHQENIDKVTKKDTQDIEAQSTAFHPEALTTDRPLSDYAYAGRGGAGNWYSPVDLQKHGDSLSEIMAMKTYLESEKLDITEEVGQEISKCAYRKKVGRKRGSLKRNTRNKTR